MTFRFSTSVTYPPRSIYPKKRHEEPIEYDQYSQEDDANNQCDHETIYIDNTDPLPSQFRLMGVLSIQGTTNSVKDDKLLWSTIGEFTQDLGYQFATVEGGDIQFTSTGSGIVKVVVTPMFLVTNRRTVDESRDLTVKWYISHPKGKSPIFKGVFGQYYQFEMENGQSFSIHNGEDEPLDWIGFEAPSFWVYVVDDGEIPIPVIPSVDG